MYGKILLSKTFLISQFNFLLSCLPSPGRNIILDLDKKLLQFIRSFKSAQKISQDMLQQNRNKGGLNLTLLKDQAIGMKLAWVTRLMSNSNQSWKKLISDFLPLKNNHFWLCNFNEKECPAIFARYKNIPYFWKEVITKWAKYNFSNPGDISNILSQPLWFNSHIRNSNNTIIYYTKSYECGIFTISDLIINNSFANFEEIISKFPNSGLNFLTYYGLLQLIPRSWKNIINIYFSNTLNNNISMHSYKAYQLVGKKKSVPK